MTTSTNWPIQSNAEDWFRQTSKRIGRMERMAAPTSASDLLGPGMSSQAVNILDWNDEVATFNGFFFSMPGAFNTPEAELYEYDPETGMPVGDPTIITNLPWTGMTIAREDGTGMQQAWNTDEPESMFFRVRNYWPNPDDPEAPVVFSDWQRFATPSGFVEGDDLAPEVQGGIQAAYDAAVEALALAEESFDYALSANAVFRQPSAPTNPTTEGFALRENDTWFDDDEGNRPYRWTGSAWEEATSAWLKTNPTGAFPNVVISPTGLVAYNGAGVAVTTIASATGNFTTTGGVFAAGDVNGSTVTGGTVQTSAFAASGIKMNSAGFTAYNAGGSPTFTIAASTGAVVMLGTLTSGSSIVGATITSSSVVDSPQVITSILTADVVRTAPSGDRIVLQGAKASFYIGATETAYLYPFGTALHVNGDFFVDAAGDSTFAANVDIGGTLDMTSGAINNVTNLNNSGGDISMNATIRPNECHLTDLPVNPGGEAIFMLANGRLVAHTTPSLLAYKRDVAALDLDLDVLASVHPISWRYSEDAPFDVDYPDEVHHGFPADSLLGTYLVETDGEGVTYAKEARLPLALLAGFGDHHPRIAQLEAEVVELTARVEALENT